MSICSNIVRMYNCNLNACLLFQCQRNYRYNNFLKAGASVNFYIGSAAATESAIIGKNDKSVILNLVRNIASIESLAASSRVFTLGVGLDRKSVV